MRRAPWSRRAAVGGVRQWIEGCLLSALPPGPLQFLRKQTKEKERKGERKTVAGGRERGGKGGDREGGKGEGDCAGGKSGGWRGEVTVGVTVKRISGSDGGDFAGAQEKVRKKIPPRASN